MPQKHIGILLLPERTGGIEPDVAADGLQLGGIEG